MTDLPPVLTVAEVAQALQISEWTVYDRIRRGDIPTVPIPFRSKRVPRIWLDQLLAGTANDRLTEPEGDV